MKKGFTLIELLAVIIILAVIALIATPLILDVVSDAEEESRLQTVNGYIEATRMYISEAMIKDLSLEGNLFDIIKDRVKGTKPNTGEIFVGEANKIAVALKLDEYCYIKNYNDVGPTRSNGGECTLGESTEVIYEVNAPTYEIDINKCVEYYKVKLSNLSDEMILGFCEGTLPGEGLTLPYVLKIGLDVDPTVNITELRESEVISDATTTQRLSCVVKEKLIDSYEVDEVKCKDYLSKMDMLIGASEEDIAAYCAPNQDSELGNLRDVFSFSYAYFDAAIKNGAIKNVVYSDEYVVTGYRCYEGNDFGMPTVTTVAIASDVAEIETFSFFSKGITSVDFSAATKLKNIKQFSFVNNSIQTLDLSGATSLKIIGTNAFTPNKLTTIKIPMNVTTIETNAFASSEENIVITIDQYEDAITGKPWGAVDATINWLPCDGVVTKELISYKIDEEACKTYFGRMFGSNATTEELADFCKGTGKVMGVIDFETAITDPNILSGVIDENVIYDTEFKRECKGCFETTDRIISYDVDINNCIALVTGGNSYNQAEAPAFCSSGGALENGDTLDELIKDSAISFISTNAIYNIVYDNTETSITRYLCTGENGAPTETDVKIPNVIDGKKVVSIGYQAFSSAGLTSIDFSEAKNLREIRSKGFDGSGNFTSIDLSGATNLTYIGSSAFAGNSNLESITIPNNVTTIENYAFDTNLKTITIDKVSGSIEGAPWGASSATVNWLRTE